MKPARAYLVLMALGAAWGATQPLGKIAVSEGYRHNGLIFWQTCLMSVVLLSVCALLRKPIPFGCKPLILYTFIAMIGTVLPGIASYAAVAHLPSGIMSILLSSVPLFALPVALAMGNDQFDLKRFFGLLLGMGGVVLLVLPDSSLPAGTEAIWIGVALLSSLCYGIEGNGVAKYGMQGLSPVQVLAGASVVGAVISLPLALGSGQFIAPQWPLSVPDLALIGSVMLHAGAYTGYVWLVTQAGSVFAAQTGYLVTLFGVIWAMVFLSESYAAWVWVAMAVLFCGVALVQPRSKPLVPGGPPGEDRPV